MSDPDTGEVNWYRPDPRAILPLEGFHCSHSLEKTLRKQTFKVTYNTAFSDVMKLCSDRPEGSWISEEFLDAFGDMHRQGKAHSVEVWETEKLVGGVYGVAVGGAFCAESMFYRRTNASKVALFHLVERLKNCRFTLLEVQFLTPHLKSLGAIEISDSEYEALLKKALRIKPTAFSS